MGVFSKESYCNLNTENDDPLTQVSVITPVAIHEALDEYVIGQEEAKRTLCIAGANHYKRLALEAEAETTGNENIVKKSNILLIGPSGCGKTYTVSALAKALEVPFATISATSITATGFVGKDVDEALRLLLAQCTEAETGPHSGLGGYKDGTVYDLKRAEKGIIFIDEIDKVRKHGINNTSGVDIGGESVQQALLTMIEGTDVQVKGQEYGKSYTINTKNILFIFGGAFPDIYQIVRDRLAASKGDAYACSLTINELIDNITDEDLEAFGFIPEFIGRVPVVAKLHSLTEEDYFKILEEPKDSLTKQYAKLFLLDNAEFCLSGEAKSCIAAECIKKERGARGLRTIMEKALADAQYLSPELKQYEVGILIDADEQGLVTIIECDVDQVDRIKAVVEKAGMLGRLYVRGRC